MTLYVEPIGTGGRWSDHGAPAPGAACGSGSRRRRERGRVQSVHRLPRLPRGDRPRLPSSIPLSATKCNGPPRCPFPTRSAKSGNCRSARSHPRLARRAMSAEAHLPATLQPDARPPDMLGMSRVMLLMGWQRDGAAGCSMMSTGTRLDDHPGAIAAAPWARSTFLARGGVGRFGTRSISAVSILPAKLWRRGCAPPLARLDPAATL